MSERLSEITKALDAAAADRGLDLETYIELLEHVQAYVDSALIAARGDQHRNEHTD